MKIGYIRKDFEDYLEYSDIAELDPRKEIYKEFRKFFYIGFMSGLNLVLNFLKKEREISLRSFVSLTMLKVLGNGITDEDILSMVEVKSTLNFEKTYRKVKGVQFLRAGYVALFSSLYSTYILKEGKVIFGFLKSCSEECKYFYFAYLTKGE